MPQPSPCFKAGKCERQIDKELWLQRSQLMKNSLRFVSHLTWTHEAHLKLKPHTKFVLAENTLTLSSSKQHLIFVDFLFCVEKQWTFQVRTFHFGFAVYHFLFIQVTFWPTKMWISASSFVSPLNIANTESKDNIKKYSVCATCMNHEHELHSEWLTNTQMEWISSIWYACLALSIVLRIHRTDSHWFDFGCISKEFSYPLCISKCICVPLFCERSVQIGPKYNK